MKISTFKAALFSAALGLSLSWNAAAATYTSLDSANSKVTFGYSQMNVDMTGGFSEIKATELSFDPAKPEATKVSLEIAVKGVDAGYAEANAEIATPSWLNIPSFPLATFTSKSVKSSGGGNYEVTGDLSIKGKVKTMTVPFTFKEENGSGIFEGKFNFQRSDFGIGEGQWADFSIVADNITINFKLVTKP